MSRAVAVALAGLVGCQQQGCLEPSSFPAEQRIDNAIQVRLARPGFERFGRELPALIDALAPGGRLGFEPQCEGDVEVCCDLPPGTCGVALDVRQRSGEPPRFEVTSTGNGQGLAVTLRSRLRTDPGPLEIEIDGFFVNGDCTVDINTERSGQPDLAVTAQLGFSTDPSFGTTQIELGGFEVTGLEPDDIVINGSGNACDFAQNNKDRVIAGVRDAFGAESANLLQVPFCKSCESDAECAPSGTCSADGSGVGVCELPLPPDADPDAAPRCLQQIGVVGRTAAGDLLGGFGTDNPVDLYAVSGFAGAPAGGLTFGINSGLMPTGGPSLDCAPAAPFPELPAGGVPIAPTLEDNLRPLGAGAMGEYDVGIAIHKSFLDRAGWAMHQTGLLCTTIDGSQIDSLNADALSLMFPSMIDLIDGANTQVSIRLRPQTPPTFGLAEGPAPVVVTFKDMDVDFFLTVRDRMVRLFSARSDVAVPVGLDVDADNALMPIVGDLSGAFSNVRITSPGVLAEKGDELAAKFETMGQLSVSLLVQSLGPIDLPATTFARPVFTRDGLQAIDGEQFLGIFGQIAIGSAAMPLRRRVVTAASVIATEVPDADAYRTLDRSRRPAVVLGVGGDSPYPEPIEVQYRIDGGAWSPFAPGPTLRISRDELWLAGRHVIEVRARNQGRPETADPTPVMLSAYLHPLHAEPRAPIVFGAQPSHSERVGGGCASAPSGGGGLWLVVVAFALAWFGSRRPNASALIALAAGLSGCVVGTEDNFRGPAYGRWSDVASDGTRALVSTYESRDGVLAIGTVVASGVKNYQIVDDAGDVGAWSSIELSGQLARIAYQDRGAGDLKVAIEDPDPTGGYHIHVVDDGGDTAVGLYADLVMRPGGGMGIAYAGSREITGTDAMGEPTEGLATELRYAETDADLPASKADWSIATITATEVLEKRPADSVPLGTGIYPSLVYLASGEPAVIYCDTTAAAVSLATRSGGVWETRVLHSDPESAPCAFASAAVDAGGTVHAVFQTTAAHDLRYLSIAGGAASTPEIVDDGARGMLDHPVGGSARLLIDRSGAPLVLYQDGYTLRLMMGRRASGSWVIEEAADEAAAFGFSIGAAYYGDSLIVSSGAINRSKKQPHVLRTLVLDE